MIKRDTSLRRRLAKVVIAGDSLAAGCPFRRLSARPLATLNLARGGARLADVEVQLRDAPRRAALSYVIDGGLNDLLGACASTAAIARDFRAVLDALPCPPRAVFTLMPHVSDKAEASRIDAANAAMAELCREYSVTVLDLNPLVSHGGARRPEMTDDGLHFTSKANALWIGALKLMLGRVAGNIGAR
ncbi:MAG: GDSL-type esterase/lipase family protein [Methylocystis sp.]